MRYSYKDMLVSAKNAGLLTDKMMWEGVDCLDRLLCMVEKEHPDAYRQFMRRQHGMIHGNHYDEEFALYDAGCLSYTGREGKECKGAHWTPSQVEEATRSMKFPAGTNIWDKYVAFNAAYSDYCRKFEDADVLEIGFLNYFGDSDWPTNTKIWDYMSFRSSLG